MPPIKRDARLYAVAASDQRNQFQRDRDRILYSTSFKRLDGITQVVRPGDSEVFHNRLTHSIKVAQVGRRLAEDRLEKQPDEAKFHGGLDVEVVEAACLGHDLGHPPFGHIGEKTLDELLTANTGGNPPLDSEGFEGNAQSFRIVTKLAVRFPSCEGLDLTKATLAALQKYPWSRDTSDPKRTSKWGYYLSESKDFEFCMDGLTPGVRTLEAELMDWADDIAYSVHDLEDFHRCNFIPWRRIIGEDADDKERIVHNALKRWRKSPDAPANAEARLREAHRRITVYFLGYESGVLTGPYEGTRFQREQIRTLTSGLIKRYITNTSIVSEKNYDGKVRLHVDEIFQDEVRLLKQIAWDYIISSPTLAALQMGQARVLRSLFEDFHDEAKSGQPRILPKRFHHLIEDSTLSPARVAADCIASLTETEALGMYQRLSGNFGGSILDPIVR
jgi:dGTPase